MTNIDTLQASFDRLEREQKVRDDGVRRSFEIFAAGFERLHADFLQLQTQIKGRVEETHQVIEAVATMLTKQDALLESVRQLIEDQAVDHTWDDLPEPPVHPPAG